MNSPTANWTSPHGAHPRPAAAHRIRLWLWAIAALIAVTALAVAIAGRDRGGGPTLRAMAASESMSPAEASATAGNTARVWVRERNERHLANLEAMSCPDVHDGVLAHEIEAVRSGEPFRQHDVVATTHLNRTGPLWTIDVIDTVGGQMFDMRIIDGELRVCQIEPAPIP